MRELVGNIAEARHMGNSILCSTKKKKKIRLVAMLSANGYSKLMLKHCRDSFQLCL